MSAGRGSRPAAVIGSGPNGLAAAVTLARAGVPVTVFEAAESIGGGTRTMQLIRQDVVHDVCAAVHPLAFASGFFRAFELSSRVEFAVPEISYAHPLAEAGVGGAAGSGRVAFAYRDLARTAAELGRDGEAYARLYRPLLHRLDEVLDLALGPSVLRPPAAAAAVGAALSFAARIAEQGSAFGGARFREEAAAALVTGCLAHANAPLLSFAAAASGLVLGALGHASGWPVPIGGSRAISDVLAADLIAHGGEIRTSHAISDVRELREYGVLICNTSARGLAQIAGSYLSERYRRALLRVRAGNGVSKVDFVLDGPVPWADARVGNTPTVHLGGSRDEIVAAERQVARGRLPERPYVIVAQPWVGDKRRNPAGYYALWSYAHVPRGSTADVRELITGQIERFAPGFRDRIISTHQLSAAELHQYNRNYTGGDIAAGEMTMRRLLAQPVLSRTPHRVPHRALRYGAPGIYLASAAAPPGPGVHGLAGWYAALAALQHEYGLQAPELGR